VAIALPVTTSDYSPRMDLFGSYFPAWMLCAVIEFHRLRGWRP
jgi:hypothetical protein